eukprot:GHUV01021828.1.p1 GENE.GHUV01021828.1~~GHUV01021828.1.p1  ORF type:complete len:178 (-),score=5.09 GHUV01021828.1:342-875(-)
MSNVQALNRAGWDSHSSRRGDVLVQHSPILLPCVGVGLAMTSWQAVAVLWYRQERLCPCGSGALVEWRHGTAGLCCCIGSLTSRWHCLQCKCTYYVGLAELLEDCTMDGCLPNKRGVLTALAAIGNDCGRYSVNAATLRLFCLRLCNLGASSLDSPDMATGRDEHPIYIAGHAAGQS